MRRGWLVRVGTNDLEVVEATVSEPVTPETIAREDADDNRHREVVWFSPACLGAAQPSLFDAPGGAA